MKTLGTLTFNSTATDDAKVITSEVSTVVITFTFSADYYNDISGVSKWFSAATWVL